ncbi:MAG: RNA polymerase sigma factor [Christensenellaceae bacterium]|nr:RNA polymerase sigma factor [Christensenellaceae bacterium]
MLEEIYRQSAEGFAKGLTRFSRDREAAMDAVQQAFLQGLLHRERLESLEGGQLRAWLYTAAKNALIDQKRRQTRLLNMEIDAELPAPAEDIEDRLLLSGLMETLSDEQREIVQMRYFAGFNASEIGRAMDLPAATVRTKLRAALTRMKNEMNKE